jgi:hypothetical protein
MDIIPVFGTVVGGSNPSESTRIFAVKDVCVIILEFLYNLMIAGMV